LVVEYELRRGDLARFALNHYVRRPFVWLAVAAVWIFTSWLTFASLPVDPGDIEQIVVAAGLSAGLATLAAVALVALLVLALLVSAARLKPGAPRTLSVTGRDVTDESEHATTRVDWVGVKRILATRGCVAIYVSPSVALLVPRRAFADEAAWREFSSLIEHSYRVAHR
jgi:hypothetical protein